MAGTVDYELLRRQSENRSEEVRREALRMLSGQESPEALQLVVRMAILDRQESVRAEAARALSQAAAAPLVRVLEGMFESADQWSRHAAIVFAVEHLGLEAASVLTMATEGPDPELRVIARDRLQELRSPPPAPPPTPSPTPSTPRRSGRHSAASRPAPVGQVPTPLRSSLPAVRVPATRSARQAPDRPPTVAALSLVLLCEALGALYLSTPWLSCAPAVGGFLMAWNGLRAIASIGLFMRKDWARSSSLVMQMTELASPNAVSVPVSLLVVCLLASDGVCRACES